MNTLLDQLKSQGLCATTREAVDFVHLLSAERAARGGFYATRVGFVGVNDKGLRFARTHNGFPVNVHETRERWSKTQKDFYHHHAECAGIFYAARMGYATKGATGYITHPPCPGCMRVLIASGFARIVFSEQSLLERHDWRDDMVKSFALAQAHHMKIAIYQDTEKTLPAADLTRTELELKKVYDELVPQARWSSGDRSAISLPAKPESPDWVDHPVVAALLKAAAVGKALAGKAIIMDYLPECRAATAIIQAGLSRVVVVEPEPDRVDARWAVNGELEIARQILEGDARTPIEVLAGAQNLPETLDATRGGITIPGVTLIRL